MGRPRKDPDKEILIARESGIWTAPNGDEYPFIMDVTRVRAGHPLAKAMPHCFKPLNVHYDIEQMTARPGERRGEEVRG